MHMCIYMYSIRMYTYIDIKSYMYTTVECMSLLPRVRRGRGSPFYMHVGRAQYQIYGRAGNNLGYGDGRDHRICPLRAVYSSRHERPTLRWCQQWRGEKGGRVGVVWRVGDWGHSGKLIFVSESPLSFRPPPPFLPSLKGFY